MASLIEKDDKSLENSLIETVAEQKLTLTFVERVDQKYNDIGGFGRFQVFAFIVQTWGIANTNWFLYPLGYFTQAPDSYICTYNGEPDVSICTVENICAGDPRIATWEADPDSDHTLDNWQQKLNLTCESDFKISMLGSSIFLGWMCTLLWLPALSDRYGRKYFFWLGIFVETCVYTGVIFTTNLNVMITLFFILGMVSSLITQVGYVYLMELQPKKVQPLVTSVWSVQASLIYVFTVVYFWQISHYWLYVVLPGYVMTWISVIGIYWLPESPRYLISMGRMTEAQAALQQIADWNKESLEWDESKLVLVDGQGTIIDATVPKTACYYLKQKTIVINLICMSMVWLGTAFGYYIILQLINTFSNVYFAGMISSITEMISYLLAGVLYDKLGAKKSLILSFTISLLGAILIWAWGLAHQSSVLFFIFFLFAKFGVTTTYVIQYMANADLFPTLFSATAFGITQFVFCIGSAIAYPVSYTDEPLPVILVIVICAAAAVSSFFLKAPQTDEEMIEDDQAKSSSVYQSAVVVEEKEGQSTPVMNMNQSNE